MQQRKHAGPGAACSSTAGTHAAADSNLARGLRLGRSGARGPARGRCPHALGTGRGVGPGAGFYDVGGGAAAGGKRGLVDAAGARGLVAPASRPRGWLARALVKPWTSFSITLLYI